MTLLYRIIAAFFILLIGFSVFRFYRPLTYVFPCRADFGYPFRGKAILLNGRTKIGWVRCDSYEGKDSCSVEIQRRLRIQRGWIELTKDFDSAYLRLVDPPLGFSLVGYVHVSFAEMAFKEIGELDPSPSLKSRERIEFDSIVMAKYKQKYPDWSDSGTSGMLIERNFVSDSGFVVPSTFLPRKIPDRDLRPIDDTNSLNLLAEYKFVVSPPLDTPRVPLGWPNEQVKGFRFHLVNQCMDSIDLIGPVHPKQGRHWYSSCIRLSRLRCNYAQDKCVMMTETVIPFGAPPCGVSLRYRALVFRKSEGELRWVQTFRPGNWRNYMKPFCRDLSVADVPLWF